MGTVNDQRRRESTQRQANGELDFDIFMAREHIFRKGKGVKSAAVKKILGPKSFVPIEVRYRPCLLSVSDATMLPLECIQPSFKIWT